MLQNSSLPYLSLTYDGSFDGFLTVVFHCFEKKILPAQITSYLKHQPSFFESSETVDTEQQKAERVWSGLRKIIPSEGSKKLFKAFLSEDPFIEMHLYNFICLAFGDKQDPSSNFSNHSVLKIEQMNKKINKEIHRMHAFVRFKKTHDNIYYAVLEPDFDVLPLIVDHFEKRYADQKWLIYDAKRSYGIFYDLQITTQVKLETSKINGQINNDHQNLMDPQEGLYELLWKSYFQSVNITERKNTKLQLRHMPKRYWKYLSETC